MPEYWLRIVVSLLLVVDIENETPLLALNTITILFFLLSKYTGMARIKPIIVMLRVT